MSLPEWRKQQPVVCVFKVNLPSGAVVYARDVAWVHPREPFTLPEPAGGAGICQHLPSGIGIGAAAAAVTEAAATAYINDAAATSVSYTHLTLPTKA